MLVIHSLPLVLLVQLYLIPEPLKDFPERFLKAAVQT